MIKNELFRVSTELDNQGYALTSYDLLGLPFDTALAHELSTSAADGNFSPDAAKLTERIEKQKMTMVQDPRTLELGKRLIRPVVETLFANDPKALKGWDLYAMNCYQTGGKLGSHQDSVGKTVLVVTASGERQFDVWGIGETEETAKSKNPEASFILNAASVMILDGQADPAHGVECIQGPSISAILDVPALLRP